MNLKVEIAVAVGMCFIVGLFGCGSEAGSGAGGGPGLMSAAVVIPGWEMEGEPQLVVGDELFELINGGAEVYHRLGFVQAMAAQYNGAEDRSVSLEVFEMKDAEAAHSMFMEKRGGTGEALPIGEESAVESYYLNFRRGAFLVTITGFDSDPLTTQALQELARAVDGQLEGIS